MATDQNLLTDISFFARLDVDERTTLAQQVELRRYAATGTIFRHGDTGGSMFLVRSGSVELWIFDDDHEKVILATLGPGEFFGELSLLDAEKRSATATALVETELVEIDRDDLRQLFSTKPDAALDVLAELGNRLRHTNEIVSHRAARNLNEVFDESSTLGERLADRIAEFGGSWPFVILFVTVMMIWITLNSVLAKAWDVYPFILLNLMLSCLAALQAPVIMMSQNRSNSKDRMRAELDYRVNTKAELEVAQLHDKFDTLRTELLDAIAGKGATTKRAGRTIASE